MIFFKLPFDPKFYTVDETFDGNAITFFSFDEKQKLDFKGKILEISPDHLMDIKISSNDITNKSEGFQEENEAKYVKKIEEVIRFVKKNQLPKLVISRRKLLSLENSEVDLVSTFLQLCKNYSNAFVYFFIKDGKCWMGAFSEVLGDFNRNTSQFKTMSLAGTLPLDENWTEKEIEEQKSVTNYVRNVLQNFSEKVYQTGTSDHISGNIKHLRTDFEIQIEESKIENVIAELHPTPAVCGIPKEFCKNAISQFETYPRNFYAGYIKVETDVNISYFVNLRCAEFFNNAVLMYVGGGITAASSPEKEWQETELKADAILNNLSFQK